MVTVLVYTDSKMHLRYKNKVSMHAGVVVVEGHLDGRIWSTLSRYCGYFIHERGT